MAKPQVFYSFHFDNDVMRVQLIRNIGVIEGNEPASKNDWEKARKTPGAIIKWINDNMYYRSCVVVLVGTQTAFRPWVQYEIKKGWIEGKGMVGIYIHNLKDCRSSSIPPFYGKCTQGPNPFEQFKCDNGIALSNYVPCHNPNPNDAYNDIARNLQAWINNAPRARKG